MPHLALIQRLILTALLGGAVGTAAAAVWWYAGRDRLRALPPTPRLRRLVALAALPLVGAVALTGVALLPSVLHAAGIAADHCGAHPSPHVHLCLVHAGHGHASSLAWIGIGAAAVWLGLRASPIVGEWVRASRQLAELRASSRYDADQEAWVVASEFPFAMAVGLAVPRVLVSDGLRAALSDEHMAVVRAHEQVHARRRHTLLQALAELVAILHVPAVRGWLSDEIELACEQIADRQAARESEGVVEVADAIVHVEKLVRSSGTRQTLRTAIDGNELERRVVGLLDDPWERSPRAPEALAAVGTAILLVYSYDVVHHGLETLFSVIL
ncbi:MAG: M48 family metalloprotease [Bradymonadaceae bacterium]